MNRATLSVLLLLLMGLVAGCGKKDKGAAPAPEGKDAAGNVTQPVSNKAGGVTQPVSTKEEAKLGGAGKQADEQDKRPPKADGKSKPVTLPAKEITLSPEVKSAFMHITEYGGRLFADEAKQGTPIVAVRAFGFGKDSKKLKELVSLEHLDVRERLKPQREPTLTAALPSFTNLRVLAGGVMSPEDLTSLADIESLETLNFDVDIVGKRPKGVTLNGVVQASLAEIAKVKHLKHLRIGNSGAMFSSHPSDYSAIPSFPELQYLETWLLCDDSALEEIAKSKTLTRLVIAFPKAATGKPTFSPRGLSALGLCPRLAAIQVQDADDAILGQLAQLDNIKELVVGKEVSKAAIERVSAKRPDLRITKYDTVFQPPMREPRDNWMQVLPANKWKQVLYSKKSSKFVLGPIETNNTENYFDGAP